MQGQRDTPDWSKTPAPTDDGGARHLPGSRVPSVALPATNGAAADLSALPGRAVVYAYPRTSPPNGASLEGWDAIPGARGCTPQSCAFRDRRAELESLGARVAGLSAQSLDDQVAFARRNHLGFPVISDPGLKLSRTLALPTFEVEGLTVYKRVTLVAERAEVAKVFYPVFPPDRNAQEVVDWLRRERA